MRTKRFTYVVRHVRNGTAHLVAYYDKDHEQCPSAIIMHTDAFKKGQEIHMEFIISSCNSREIMGD